MHSIQRSNYTRLSPWLSNGQQLSTYVDMSVQISLYFETVISDWDFLRVPGALSQCVNLSRMKTDHNVEPEIYSKSFNTSSRPVRWTQWQLNVASEDTMWITGLLNWEDRLNVHRTDVRSRMVSDHIIASSIPQKRRWGIAEFPNIYKTAVAKIFAFHYWYMSHQLIGAVPYLQCNSGPAVICFFI